VVGKTRSKIQGGPKRCEKNIQGGPEKIEKNQGVTFKKQNLLGMGVQIFSGIAHWRGMIPPRYLLINKCYF